MASNHNHTFNLSNCDQSSSHILFRISFVLSIDTLIHFFVSLHSFITLRHILVLQVQILISRVLIQSEILEFYYSCKFIIIVSSMNSSCILAIMRS